MRLHSKNLVMVEVIDNFLPLYQFNQIQSCILDTYFNWYFDNGILGEDIPPGFYQFTHGFSSNYGNNLTTLNSLVNKADSNLSPLLEFCINKIGVNRLIRVKANLNPRTVFHRNGGYHLDQINNPSIKVAILYINTNNGCTKIKGYGKVKCVANRLVKFHSSVEHAGISCTDEKRKVVLNFNYE